MEKLPIQNSLVERQYFNQPESSEAYGVAEETHAAMKKACDELMWITGNERHKTSKAIQTRWDLLKQRFAYIRKPADKYCTLMMLGIETTLEDEVKYTDEANIEYDDQPPSAYFSGYIKDYADVILKALKKEMSEDEKEMFENNYF